MSSDSQDLETCSGARSWSIRPAPWGGLAIADPTAAGTAPLALVIAGALTAAACLVALVVHIALAARARRWLAFPFAGLPAAPHVAATIFLHNLRALTAVGGLLLIAQSPCWTTHTTGGTQRTLQRLGEVMVAAAVAANVLVVGASLGAYGMRMVRALVPHGPVELAAYSLVLALYLEGRKRPLPPTHVAAIVLLSVITLALAAVLEVFVNL